MIIVPSESLYELNKDKNNLSLWMFAESEQGITLLGEKKCIDIIKWINYVNYKHHNEANFYDNFKEVFTKEDKLELSEGVETVAALRLKEETIIIRNAEMGVNFALNSPKIKKLSLKEWVNFEKILSAIDIGLYSAKNFHLFNQFDNMNNELNFKDSKKEIKVKL